MNCVGDDPFIGNYPYVKFDETTVGGSGVQVFGMEYVFENFPNDPRFNSYIADGKSHASSEYISRCEKGVLITEYRAPTGSREDFIVLGDGRLKILYYSNKTEPKGHDHEWLCELAK